MDATLGIQMIKPVEPTPHCEQIMHLILDSCPAGTEAAFILWKGQVLYARGRVLKGVPDSPIVRLIQGLYEVDPANTQRLTRSRIYASYEPTIMCFGMMKVAAHRLTASTKARAHGLPVRERLVELKPVALAEEPAISAALLAPDPHGYAECERDRLFLSLAMKIAAGSAQSSRRHERDRPIAALLVSAEGKILAIGKNTNGRNRTLHAELNLLRSLRARTGGGIPAGATLYSSLKPCRMCAGMIWHCSEHRASLRVVYAQHDAGPNAAETVLDAHTPDRRRATSDDLQRQYEFLLEP